MNLQTPIKSHGNFANSTLSSTKFKKFSTSKNSLQVEEGISSHIKFLKSVDTISPKVKVWDNFEYPSSLDEIKSSLAHQSQSECDRVNSLIVGYSINL